MSYKDVRLVRKKVLMLAKRAMDLNLITGAEGNFSVRVDEKSFAITPSAVEYDEMGVDDIVIIDIHGEKIYGEREPSSEWRLHAEIYKEFKDVNSVVHVHPVYATVISVVREEIPVIIDEQVFYIGGSLRVSNYAPSGTLELARNVIDVLRGRKAAIIANHGLVAVGKDEKAALYVAMVAEKISKIYYLSKLTGGVNTIPEEVLKEFSKKRYGRYL